MVAHLKHMLLISLFFSGSLACSKDQLSPEDCVKTYAQLLNQGKLKEAQKLCTPAAQAFLTALGDVIAASETSPDSTEIIIKTIQCQHLSVDSVYCISQEYDGFEEYEKTYWLILQEDKWLIDQPSAKGILEKREERLEVE